MNILQEEGRKVNALLFFSILAYLGIVGCDPFATDTPTVCSALCTVIHPQCALLCAQ